MKRPGVMPLPALSAYNLLDIKREEVEEAAMYIKNLFAENKENIYNQKIKINGRFMVLTRRIYLIYWL